MNTGPDHAVRLHDLQARLDAARAHAGGVGQTVQEELKAEIIALFREADAALRDAQALKEAVKGLAEQWKRLDGPAGALTPQGLVVPNGPPSDPPGGPTAAVTEARPASARADHLGASTFIEKGWSRLSLGDLAGAEAALRRALELAAGNSEAETLLGWTLMLQGQHEAARMILEAVLQRDSGYALARANLGYLSWRTGRPEDAIEQLQAVLHADGDRKATLYAYLYLGMVHGGRGAIEEAEHYFHGALERGPNLLQAWYELGRAYWLVGRQADALTAWSRGAVANTFSPWGKRCAALLTTIDGGGTPQFAD